MYLYTGNGVVLTRTVLTPAAAMVALPSLVPFLVLFTKTIEVDATGVPDTNLIVMA